MTAAYTIDQQVTSPWLPKGGKLTQGFGTPEVLPQFGLTGQPHQGIDISGQRGDPVVLPAGVGATVEGAGWDAFGGGNFVKLGLLDGTQVELFHLQNVAVKMGQTLNGGDLLGHLDSTGSSTGDHLHFQVNVGGKPVDPWTWLTQLGHAGTSAPEGGSLNPFDAVKNVNDFFGHLITPGHDPCHPPTDELGVLKVIDGVTCPQNWWKVGFTSLGIVLIGIGVFIYFIREEKQLAVTVVHDAAPIAEAA